MLKNAIIEIAIFTVKEDSIISVAEIRSQVKKSLHSFNGFISINTLQPVNSSRVFADIVLWKTLEDAHIAAEAFEAGDERFLPYMQCIEDIKFMGHFIENTNEGNL
jgi:heme-degrading monooxygenase HmoA